eukprot:3774198-Pleurochrysis_carterae.AAC.1
MNQNWFIYQNTCAHSAIGGAREVLSVANGASPKDIVRHIEAMSDIKTRVIEEKPWDPDEKGMSPTNLVFTHFTYATSDKLRKFLLDQVPETFKYIRFGVETCPKTHRVHLQGWCVLAKRMKKKAVNAILQCWCEGMKGSSEDNEEYTSKEGESFFRGLCPKIERGKRSDLDKFKKAVQNGNLNMKRLREEFSQ